MKIEKRQEVGLPSGEEVSQVKGKGPGEHQENDDEHRGNRRGKIPDQLPFENDADSAHGVPLFRCIPWLS